MRCNITEVVGRASLLHNVQMTLGLKPQALIRHALLIARKIGPFVIFAAAIHLSGAAAIQDGSGTARTWRLPTKSAKSRFST